MLPAIARTFAVALVATALSACAHAPELPIADASAVNIITVSYVGSADTADTPSGNNS